MRARSLEFSKERSRDGQLHGPPLLVVVRIALGNPWCFGLHFRFSLPLNNLGIR